MMALHPGGRPGASRRVRLVPVRQSGMDHRAVARIVLAMARQMAAEADEAAQSAADDVVSSGAGVCAGREPGSSDGSAAASDAAAPWAGAHSGQSACGVASVGRCTANGPFSASPSGCSAGRRSHQRHDGARYLAHGAPSTTSHVLPDRAGTADSGEDAASSTPGGTP